MTEIKRSRNIVKIMSEIKEKKNNLKINKTKSISHEFLFFPLMDIEKKFKISNKFDKKHSEKFLKEKDKFLEIVELDDKLPEEIEESPIYNISTIGLLDFTFGM